jgi:taurine transport system substrate-binding protein
MIAQGLGTAESLIAKADGHRQAGRREGQAHRRSGRLDRALFADGRAGPCRHRGNRRDHRQPAADQIAAAWDSGQVDAAFIWEPVQNQILQTGTFIVGADQTAAWGYPTFDGWVVNKAFAEANADAMVAFAKVMNEANMAYLADPAAWTADSAGQDHRRGDRAPTRRRCRAS